MCASSVKYPGVKARGKTEEHPQVLLAFDLLPKHPIAPERLPFKHTHTQLGLSKKHTHTQSLNHRTMAQSTHKHILERALTINRKGASGTQWDLCLAMFSCV